MPSRRFDVDAFQVGRCMLGGLPSPWFDVFDRTLTRRNDEPMRNLDISSNRALKTRESPRYVPLVDRKSCKRMASRLTSTAQCTRDTFRSSISMSAPPPSRPMVMSGRDNSYSIPCDEPAITEILIVLSCGSARSAVREFGTPSSLESLYLSCGADELTAIVCGPGSIGDELSSMGKVHIQHVTCEGRPLANRSSSKCSFALQ